MLARFPELNSARSHRGFMWTLCGCLVALLAFGSVSAAQASDEGLYRTKEEREEAKKRKKEAEKKKKEAEKKRKKEEEEKRKAEEKKRKEAEKLAKKNKGKVETPHEGPTRTRKTGEPINDYIVDFETAYAGQATLFEVKPEVRHDYDACSKVALKLEKASRMLVKVHEDRLRQHGNFYHHDLELLAINTHRLRVAIAEHHRTDIFTYWAQIKLMRDRLALTMPWKPVSEAWKK